MRRVMKLARFAQANIGLIVLVLGLILLLCAQTFEVTWAKVRVDQVIAAIGSAVIFSGALQWLFDSFSKPHLFREIAGRALGNERLVWSGLQNYFTNSKTIDYSEAILNDDDLVIAVNYSPRLLDDYFQQLRERVDKGKAFTVIALADDSRGYKYATTWDEQSGHILPNLQKIERRVREIDAAAPVKISLLRHSNLLSYSFVATRRVVWFKLYRNSTGPASVPAFCVGRGTELFKYFWDDIECLKKEALENGHR